METLQKNIGNNQNERPCKVLYISSKRAKELDVLQFVPNLTFIEIRLNFRISKWQYLKKVLSLPYICLREKPDNCFFESCGIFLAPALFVCLLFRIPYQVKLNGNIWEETYKIESTGRIRTIYTYLNRIVFLFALRHAKQVLPISGFLKQVCESKLGHQKKISVFNNHIDQRMLESVNKTPLDTTQRQNKLALTVSNFNFYKKTEPFFKSVPAISDALTNEGWEWVVIGNGTFYKQFIAILPQKYHHHFIGEVNMEQLMDHYRASSLLIYVSGLDGHPNVILEAALFRLPIIMNYDCPAVEFIQHEKTGILIDINDPDKLQASLKTILEEGEKLKRLGQNLSDELFQQYTPKSIADKIEKNLII